MNSTSTRQQLEALARFNGLGKGGDRRVGLYDVITPTEDSDSGLRTVTADGDSGRVTVNGDNEEYETATVDGERRDSGRVNR